MNIALPVTEASSTTTTSVVEFSPTVTSQGPPNIISELEFAIDLNIPLGLNISQTEVGPIFVSDVKIDSQLSNKVFPQDIIYKIMDQHVSNLSVMKQLLSQNESPQRQTTLVILRKKQCAQTTTMTTSPNKEVGEKEDADATAPPRKKRRTTLREITKSGVSRNSNRKQVKDAIASAYELHKATETLSKLLEGQTVESQPLLKQELNYSLASMQFERDDILKIDKRSHLTPWENRFRQYVLNAICLKNHPLPKKYSCWATTQRRLRDAFLLEGKIPEGATTESTASDIDLLNRVGFSWEIRQCKNWEDHFANLTEFHRQNGHCRVPQAHPKLGEWVKRMRKEHPNYLSRQETSEGENSSESKTGVKRKTQQGPALTPERVEAMNKLGFLWKIRIGRPRKGDDRFRLRSKRKSSNTDEPTSDANKDFDIV